MSEQRKRVTFEQRMVLVWDKIWETQGELSIQEIANVCQLKRSPYLSEVVSMLVHKKCLNRQVREGKRGKLCIAYSAADDPLPLLQAIQEAETEQDRQRILYGPNNPIDAAARV